MQRSQRMPATFISLVLLAIGDSASAARSRPDIISLPLGFAPEGIARGEGSTAYVGSILDGSIWKGDLYTGEGDAVVTGDGDGVLGLGYDKRTGYLYVAGLYTGNASIYDTEDFHLIAEVQLFNASTAILEVPSLNFSSAVNDLIVTKHGVYFTDSIQPQLYLIPTDQDSGEPLLNDESAVVTIPYDSGFVVNYNGTNANGIEVTAGGDTLIVALMVSGELYAVDAASGEATLIDLGGEKIYGDGMVLRKSTLWVVENTYMGWGTSRIVEVELSADLSCGTVVRSLTTECFDDPATAILKGRSLYAVNAKFSVAADDVNTTEYEIVRVDLEDSGDTCVVTST